MNSYAERSLVFCLSIFPIFLLTIKGWVGGVLVLAFIFSSVIAAKNYRSRITLESGKVSQPWVFVLAATLASPALGVFMGQLFRMDFSWAAYDSPIRFAACIPVMFAIIQCRINLRRIINMAIPWAVIVTLISIAFVPNNNQIVWGPDRVTTYFVDPLTFGSLSLMLGILSLISINQLGKDSWLSVGLKIFVFFIGIYLSINSGSRTGWLALPVVVFLSLHFLPKKRKGLLTTFGLLAAILISTAIYHFSLGVQQRIDLAVQELVAYQWYGLNPPSSIGYRISFIRIAFYLFLKNPLGGWGDNSFQSQLDAPELSLFSDPAARDFVLHAGFHNELFTNMVRSGVWGLLSSLALFVVPVVFFVSRLSSKLTLVRGLGFYGICFMTCAFINGMSTEVFNLKFTASFYALMLVCLCGAILAAEQSNTESMTYEKT